MRSLAALVFALVGCGARIGTEAPPATDSEADTSTDSAPEILGLDSSVAVEEDTAPDYSDAKWSDITFDDACGGLPKVCTPGPEAPEQASKMLWVLLVTCKFECGLDATIEIGPDGCVTRLALSAESDSPTTRACLAAAVAARSWQNCGRFVHEHRPHCLPK